MEGKTRATARSKGNKRKTQKETTTIIAGADLAPVGWSSRLVSFGSGSSGQLGTSALLDTKNKHCSTSLSFHN
jgi:hypothetical protein